MASQSSPRVFGEDRLAGAALVRVREGAARSPRTRSSSARRVAPRSLRGHGHGHDGGGRRPRRRARSRRRSPSARPSPRSEPSGAGPAGDGDAQPRLGAARWPRAPPSAGSRSVATSGTAEAEPGGRAREPVEVPRPGERHAAVDAQRLEHAVADEQAVVERRDPRRVDGDRARRSIQTCIAPSAHDVPPHGRRSRARRRLRGGGPPSARSRPTRRPGSESATMPPPTPRYVRRRVDRERADGDGEVGPCRGRRRSSRWRRSRRRGGTGSRSSMACSTRRLGCAGDRRGRERRPQQSRRARRRRAARPRTVLTRWTSRGAPRPRTAPGTEIEPGLADAAEVVASEVDDHHVLGAVLRAGAQPRRASPRCP